MARVERWPQLQGDEPEGGAAPGSADPAAAPHGGESLLDLLARIGGWLDHLQAGTRRQTGTRCVIIAVTHPAVIRAAIVHALDATPSAFWRIHAPPLTRVRLSGHAGRWNLRALDPPPLHPSR